MVHSPIPDLSDQTPLQAASTPNLDFLASRGEYGLLTIPGEAKDFLGGILQLTLLGYDPRKYFTGPGFFTSAGLEVMPGRDDVAFLCSLVSLGGSPGKAEGKKLGVHVLMDDETSGGIETEEARELIDAVNEQLGSETIQFFLGVGHRHLMVWVGGISKVTCFDPHLAMGQEVGPFLPAGEGSSILKELMEASRVILRNHPVNVAREAANLKPANCLWLWGPAKTIDLPRVSERFRVSGAIVSSSAMHLGIGICAGMKPFNPGNEATEGKRSLDHHTQLVLGLLPTYDLVYVHIPESSGLQSSLPKERVSWLEEFDQNVVGPLIKMAPGWGDHQILVACNTWRGEPDGGGFSPLPFVLYDSRNIRDSGGQPTFNEVDVCSSSMGNRDASRILDRLLMKN